MATGAGFAAVVLAAGRGSRFGGGKLTAAYEGRPLLHHALAAAKAAPVDEIVVVTGADSEAVEACVADFDPEIRTIHAPDYAEGMAASLRTGLSAVSSTAIGAFVLLGDMPRVPHAVLGPLAQAVREGATAAAPTFAGRRGNPVVLSRQLFADVADLAGDVGARPVLERLGAGLRAVVSPDDGVLFDVDVPADLSGQTLRS